MNENISLANPLMQFLDKQREDFTRSDILRVIEKYDIERITFHYTGIDGQLKELKLPFSNLKQAERILAAGERVDGSSLFKGLVDASLSDLYVVPNYKTVFRSPFDENSLDFICRFLDRNGDLAPFPPDNILSIAHKRFRERTAFDLYALGELEFFLLADGGPEFFTPQRQAGYHASSPFFKGHDIVNEMLRYIQQITGAVKYAHAEVGFIESVRSNNPLLDGRRAEQHEIEFLTCPIEDMGDFVALAKWIIRNVAYKHNMLATFAPKLEEGIAGNGMHVHLELMRNGRNMMVDTQGKLSTEAQKLIGGLIKYASTLSAFGNTVASAFLRLVPNQEAPTRICWSYSNRSSLVRVPLGWSKTPDLAKLLNPQEAEAFRDERGFQTVELRSPDGSALYYLLLAGLTTAAEWGLSHPSALDLSRNTYVEGNIFDNEALLTTLEPLPASCVACSRLLHQNRDLYETYGVFPTSIIDYVIKLLAKEKDETLNQDLAHISAEERLTATRNLMHKDIYRH